MQPGAVRYENKHYAQWEFATGSRWTTWDSVQLNFTSQEVDSRWDLSTWNEQQTPVYGQIVVVCQTFDTENGEA